MTELFFKAQLPMPPSVNGYWLVKPKGKYLSAKARKFRSEVIAYVASLGLIRTHTGRIRAQVTIHGRDKRKFDIDNYQKALWDSSHILTLCISFHIQALTTAYELTKSTFNVSSPALSSSTKSLPKPNITFDKSP